MPRHDVICIGASAGGVEALKLLVRNLPENLPAAVLIVLHVWPEGPSFLPQILSHAGRLPAIHPSDGERLRYGQIYVAPPDRHLLVREGHVRVLRGPKENRHRPAVDPLFRSAAATYGERVLGVILTGALDDGTAGLLAVKSHRGVAIVQDPEDSAYRGMPESAIASVNVDYVLPLAEIAGRLAELAVNGAPPKTPQTNGEPFPQQEEEIAVSELDMAEIERDTRPGMPSVYSCPECHGNLWELEEGKLLRFRCRVGHAYTAKTLDIEQSSRMEEALWAAFRSLEESAALQRRLAERARVRGHIDEAANYEESANARERSGSVLRDVLLRPRSVPENVSEPAPVPLRTRKKR